MGGGLLSLARSAAMRPVRNALRPVLSHWNRPVAVRLDTGHECYVDLRSAIGRGLLTTGRFDESISSIVREHLSPGATFVDVGANIGYYSMVALSRVGPQGRVHAFEIDPRALRCLRLTRRRNDLRNFALNEVALGDGESSASLVMSEDCGHTFARTGSGPGAVPVKPLDHWLDTLRHERVRLIKIDVEGAEVNVLRGASGVLQVCRPAVVCEVVETSLARFGASQRDLTSFMQGLGYRGTPLAGNDPGLLFTPEARS